VVFGADSFTLFLGFCRAHFSTVIHAIFPRHQLRAVYLLLLLHLFFYLPLADNQRGQGHHPHSQRQQPQFFGHSVSPFMQDKVNNPFYFIIGSLMESAPRFLCDVMLAPDPQHATAELALQVPEDARQPVEELLACPACGRVYWRGSHYKRMRRKLAEWQEASPHA
jgi:hypothetical protein